MIPAETLDTKAYRGRHKLDNGICSRCGVARCDVNVILDHYEWLIGCLIDEAVERFKSTRTAAS